MKHASDQEKLLGKKWKIDFNKPKSPPKNYKVNNFGVDRDIKDSLKNLSNQEKIHGKWVLPDEEDIQTKSDPICNSVGCTQYQWDHVKGHPKDYFVPNFGVDEDIRSTQQNEAAASTKIGHQW